MTALSGAAASRMFEQALELFSQQRHVEAKAILDTLRHEGFASPAMGLLYSALLTALKQPEQATRVAARSLAWILHLPEDKRALGLRALAQVEAMLPGGLCCPTRRQQLRGEAMRWIPKLAT